MLPSHVQNPLELFQNQYFRTTLIPLDAVCTISEILSLITPKAVYHRTCIYSILKQFDAVTSRLLLRHLLSLSDIGILRPVSTPRVEIVFQTSFLTVSDTKEHNSTRRKSMHSGSIDALKPEQHPRVEITRLPRQKVHLNMYSFLFAVVKFETTKTKMTAMATRSQRQSLVRRQQLFGRIHYLRLPHGDVIDQQHITLPPNLLNKYSRAHSNSKNYATLR